MSTGTPERRIEPTQSREGVFDVQLSLLESDPSPLVYVGPTGEERPFRVHALADTIRTVGTNTGEIDTDTSWSLANAVTLFFASSTDEAPRGRVSSKELHRATKRVLREMGFDKSAAAYARLERHAGVANPSGREVSAPDVAQPFDVISVPKTEVERVLGGRGALGSTPELTGAVLGGMVKAAYAREHVFDSAAVLAHDRGDIHLRGLADVDRLSAIWMPMERLKLTGIETADTDRLSAPAREAEAFIAQITGQTAAYAPYVAEAVHWEAVNFSLVPYVHHLDTAGLQGAAKTLLYEFALRTMSQSGSPNEISLHLYDAIPEFMHGLELAGPGGAYTERTAADYSVDAVEFAVAMIEQFAEIHRQPESLPVPRLVVHVTPQSLAQPAMDGVFGAVCAAAACGSPLEIRCASDAPLLPHAGDLLSATAAVAQCVTLNLPRAAHLGKNVRGLFDELERMIEIAARAHVRKRAFLDGLMGSGGKGPLGLLSARYGGQPAVDLSRATYVIGVAGLNDCVRVLMSTDLHEADEATDVAELVVSFLAGQCAQWSEDLGLDIVLEPTDDFEMLRRFAEADFRIFGDVASRTLARPADVSAYTPGVSPTSDAALNAMGRLGIESKFHPHLCSRSCVRLASAEVGTSPDAVANLIRQAFLQTPCRGLRFG